MITSSRNPKIQLARALQGRAKERREAAAFVVEGIRLIEEAEAKGWSFRFILYDGSIPERGGRLVERLSARGIETDEIPAALLKSLSDTETPQGLLAVLDFTSLPVPGTPDFVLIPDQVRDPGNLGTLLRTAAAAGVQAVFLPPETTDPFAPKVLRSGMGAHFHLPIRSMQWREIQKATEGLQIFLADMDGTSCWESDLRPPLALIVGGEAEGASIEARRLAARRITIPMAGQVESLNAGVAGSVLMFEIARQRALA